MDIIFRNLHLCQLSILLALMVKHTVSQSVHCACRRTFKPVCATDGRTYNNLCRLMCFSKRDQGLRVAYVGTCCPKPYCPPVYDPVCDSQGRTHENECMYRYAYCVMKKMDQVILSIVNKGPCTQHNACSEHCANTFDPVCDLEGTTHTNLCLFRKANCQAKVEGGKELLLAYRGRCYEADNLISPRGGVSHTQKESQSSPGAHPRPLAAFERPLVRNSISRRHQKQNQNIQRHNKVTIKNSLSPELQNEPNIVLPPSTVSYKGSSHSVIAPLENSEPLKDSDLRVNLPVIKGPQINFKVDLPQVEPESNHINHRIVKSLDAKPRAQKVSLCVPDNCKSDFQPVCDSLGLSHVNRCLYKYYACILSERGGGLLTIAHEGACPQDAPTKEELQPIKPPPQIRDRVAIEPESLTNEEITELDEVVPRPEPPAPPAQPRSPGFDITLETLCPGECEDTVDTVEDMFCDNTNTTHNNLCRFQMANCLSKIYDNAPLILVHFGACGSQSPIFTVDEELCPDQCTLEYYPICDSDNTTQGNLCQYQTASCIRRKQGRSPLEIVNFGPCFHREPKETSRVLNLPTRPPLPQLDERLIKEIPKTPLAEQIFSASLDSMPLSISESDIKAVPFSSKSSENGCETECPRTFEPVCAGSNKTFLNDCELDKFNCFARARGSQISAVKYRGACKASISRPKEEQRKSEEVDSKPMMQSLVQFICPKPECNATEEPVCDHRGITHINVCMFNHARCLARKDEGVTLELAYEGKCLPDNCFIPSKCINEDFSPVCATNFKTYPNKCRFQQASCLSRSNPTNDHLEILYSGTCEECMRLTECHQSHTVDLTSTESVNNGDQLVCDDFSVTHDRCEFQVASCMYEKRFGHPLQIRHSGRCCSPSTLSCNSTEDVCDSQGVTHASICHYNAYMCSLAMNNTSVKAFFIVHQGSCNASSPSPITTIPGNSTVANEVKEKELFRETIIEEIINLNTANDTQIIPLAETNTTEIIPTTMNIMAETTFFTTTTTSHPIIDLGGDPIRPHEVCPRSCPHLYQPVCGTDSNTYPNRCHLHMSRCAQEGGSWPIDISYAGECCDRDCPKHWYPVCDTDDSTHANLCEFGKRRCMAERKNRAKIGIASYGICAASECTHIEACTNVYEPVCASDGRTYINRCHLNQAMCLIKSKSQSLSLDYPGECCSKSDCPYTYEPVCDSSGRTHVNKCVFSVEQCRASRKNESLQVEYNGACCSRPCKNEHEPVCDGFTTHKNMCKFRVAQCEAQQSGLDLSVAYQGECCVLDESCGSSAAQCDTDGDTHRNMCDLNYKRCITNRLNNRTVEFAYPGKCCQMQECPGESSPICDSQDITHLSECHFENEKCKYEKMNNSTLELEYRGPCCSNFCSDEWLPVCDQHGRLYTNKCHFDSRACQVDRQFRRMLLAAPCPSRVLRRFAR